MLPPSPRRGQPHGRPGLVRESGGPHSRPRYFGGTCYAGAVGAVDDETLFSALAVIRAAPAGARGDRELDPAWRAVVEWLARRVPGPAKEDVRQEALVKVLRNIEQCEARGPTSTASWLLKIARRTAIDDDRSARASPIDKALRSRPADVDPLDELRAPDATESLSETAVEDLAAELEDALERSLVERHPSPEARILPRVQARARLYRRLLGRSVADVREALMWHAPVTDAVVSKWIERGQAPLDAAVLRWIADDPDGRSVLGEQLRAGMAERREDAGRPRPARRSRTDGAGRRLSVGSGGARPRACGSRSMAVERERGVRPGGRGRLLGRASGPVARRQRPGSRGRR